MKLQNFFKIHKISLDTNTEQNIQTLNTRFRRNNLSDITSVKKKKTRKAGHADIVDFRLIYRYQIFL